jgi:hypothetical protein
MRNCPKCNQELENDATECQKCGIVLSKYEKFQIKKKANQSDLLINCKVCDGQLSKRAEVCPNCGEPNDSKITSITTPDKIIQPKVINEFRNRSSNKKKVGKKDLIISAVVVAFCIIFLFIYYSPKSTNSATDVGKPNIPVESYSQENTKAINYVGKPDMPLDLKNAVTSEIEDRELVKDAHIVEKDETVYLTIKVNDSCSRNYARSLGDDFVRLYISLSPQESDNPGKMIGITQFNYYVNVKASGINFLAQGSKGKDSSNIDW